MAASCLTSPSSRSSRKATPSRSSTSPASSAAGGSPPSRSSPPRATRRSSAPRWPPVPGTRRAPSSSTRSRTAGGECAEGVASASSFAAFAEATSPLRRVFEEALAAMRPPASLLVADGFLYWASPSVSFLGTSAFAHVVREACVRDKPGASAARQGGAGDGAFTGTYTVPEFPHLQFSIGDLGPPPRPLIELDAKMAAAIAASQGIIMNTFYDLEGRYVEHWNRHIGPRAWPVGPLCLARQSSSSVDHAYASRPPWML
ncbi:hypothetical protein BAE44_0004465 [Dichanthelium oligosanthes]|uniref:Uncharacterized protein n=1 Tax=Dichanthelium oligosanthes TaxID=888268 RepID=A0A1E5WAW0_9POAL|nr:hypothetical protein BAE44_0004465 [Dichanthelium oligosanthes]